MLQADKGRNHTLVLRTDITRCLKAAVNHIFYIHQMIGSAAEVILILIVLCYVGEL